MTKKVSIELAGWVERDGVVLSPGELGALLPEDPLAASSFGGEFSLAWDGYRARDALGIVPGPAPPGTILAGDRVIGKVAPCFRETGLLEAIVTAVRLRSDRGIVALSGGVDSALVAAIARLPCIVAGFEGSSDLAGGTEVARLLGLDCTQVIVTPSDLEDAVARVLCLIPEKNPLDLSIALCWHFIARSAREAGYDRVLSGQGADELFGGYSRYLGGGDTDALLAADFARLPGQVARDQAVTGAEGLLLSYPYLDARVIAAAAAIPAGEKVSGGVRKRALREVAGKFLPPGIAGREKKAMQYGSGIWRELQKFARRKGCRTVGEFLARVA
ncbi:MAG: asparagine synthase C-terminal domain-containing protein [Methanolinea sp.]|nr:asparagine synthase C-terminal domain-containing protein [Methanolinea sp.]